MNRNETMLQMYRDGKTFVEIAREFGITDSRVSQIIKRMTQVKTDVKSTMLRYYGEEIKQNAGMARAISIVLRRAKFDDVPVSKVADYIRNLNEKSISRMPGAGPSVVQGICRLQEDIDKIDLSDCREYGNVEK